MLSRIEATLEHIVLATARYQRVIISVPDEATHQRLTATFDAYGIPKHQLLLIVAPPTIPGREIMDRSRYWTKITSRCCWITPLPAGAVNSLLSGTIS